jgi:PKD repeat protein
MLAITLFLANLSAIDLALAADPPITFKVEPAEYYALKKNEVFTINITISNVNASQRIVGVEFRLGYNDTLLEVLNVSEGSFFKQFNQSATPPFTFFIYYLETGYYGPHVLVGIILMPNATGQWPSPMPQGSGTIAQVTFRAIYQPAEPLSPANCTLDLFNSTAVNDSKERLPVTEVDGYYEIVQALHPIPAYTYTPPKPTAGQEMIFNASGSRDPDGSIIWYYWEFEDGTTINTTSPVVTHVFHASGEHLVKLTVKDIDDLTSTITKLVQIGAPTPIEVRIDTGSLYFRAEICEYNVLITYLGIPLDVQRISAVLYFEGSMYANLTDLIESIKTGYYRIPYTIPGTAEAGAYTLLVEAEYNGIKGANIKSFQISQTLAAWGDSIAQITEIKNDIATISTSLNSINVNLTAINAKLVDIEGSVATISSDIGTLQTSLQNINASITGLIVNSKGEILASITSALNTLTVKLDALNATIVEVKGNTATILTSLGEFETTLGDTQSAATTTLYVTSALSAIAVILAAVILMILRKK